MKHLPRADGDLRGLDKANISIPVASGGFAELVINLSNSHMSQAKHYYHCASKGLEDNVLFASREQFVSGMNRVGICRILIPEVIIFAFVLMDNHVHFILYGTLEDCNRFMAQYKRLTCISVSQDNGRKLEGFEFNSWLIPNKEKLIEKICYVLRNPFVAGMGVMPTSYIWGSGPLMFNPESSRAFHPLGNTSIYSRRKNFSTTVDIPSDWLVDDKWMLWPGNYVDLIRAESHFGCAAKLLYELCKKNEDLINQEMYGSSISLHDNDVLSILERNAEDLFGNKCLDYLDVEQRLDLIRAMKKQGTSDVKQLGRLLHLKYSELRRIW